MKLDFEKPYDRISDNGIISKTYLFFPRLKSFFFKFLIFSKPNFPGFNLFRKTLFLLLITLSFSLPHLFAQSNIPVGSWKYHQSYKDAGLLTGSDRTVFYQGKESLFYFSTEDHIPYPLTRLDGLYGQSFTASAFDPVNRKFIVSYPDGTLDLIGEKKVESIPALRENNQITAKKISRIRLIGGRFYLAAEFGLAQIDPASGRFLDAFLNIGPNGSILAVKDMVRDAQFIYLATLSGVLKGDLNQNLKDFRNWELLGNTLGNGFVEAENLEGRLIFLGTDQQLYILNGDSLELIIGTNGTRNLKKFENAGYFLKDEDLYKLGPVGSFSLFLETNQLLVSDFHFSGPDLYLSIPGRGVVRHGDGLELFASGPETKIQQFHWDEQGTFALPVFRNSTGNLRTSQQHRSSKLENGFWKEIQSPEGVMTKANFQNNTYFGTNQNGLWKEEAGLLKKIDFQGIRQGNAVWTLAHDHQNQLWVGFGDNQESLLKIDPSGNSQAVSVPGLQLAYKIIVDQADNLWILQSFPSGITRLSVYNERRGLNRLLGTSIGQGGIPAGQVLDMDLDLEDNLWLGLSNGVVYLPRVSGISTVSEINAIAPLFENRNLLSGQTVKAVRVAPDQSKWFGTESDGLWHFSEFGDELRGHFTRSNSPLSANSIVNLNIDPQSGELLIVLPDAALAYRGRSIHAAGELSSLKIFPNPVRPDFSGLLSLEGLTDFATIKITNSVGRLMFSGQVRGGKATWNLRVGQSGKVSPGVYLVFVLDESGAERVAGKFVVL